MVIRSTSLQSSMCMQKWPTFMLRATRHSMETMTLSHHLLRPDAKARREREWIPAPEEWWALCRPRRQSTKKSFRHSLNNTRARTKARDTKLSMRSGVKQGAVESPTFFAIPRNTGRRAHPEVHPHHWHAVCNGNGLSGHLHFLDARMR